MLIDLKSLPSEHILEIRYKPMGSLLDVRGRLADAIAATTDLKAWNIGANRIDFRINEEATAPERAFISHANLAYIVRNPGTQNYFAEHAGKFIREAIKSKAFVLPPVTRFGIRLQALLPYAGTLPTLVQQATVALGQDVQKLSPIGGELVDIGPVMILRREGVMIQMRCGPMEAKQAKEALPNQKNIPPVGLYVDIDQYQEDLGEIGEGEIAARLRNWSRTYWDALEGYEQQILISTPTR